MRIQLMMNGRRTWLCVGRVSQVMCSALIFFKADFFIVWTALNCMHLENISCSNHADDKSPEDLYDELLEKLHI